MMAFFIPEDLPEAYAWLPDSWNTLVDRIAELEAELTLSRQQTEYANEALKAALDRDYEAREELAALKGMLRLTWELYRGTGQDTIPWEYEEFVSNLRARAEEGGGE